MLRKDVKLGFAIGGVMLAVLVVYVLVVPGNDRKGAQLLTDDSQQSTQVKGGDKPADAPVPPAMGDTRPPETPVAEKSGKLPGNVSGSNDTPPTDTLPTPPVAPPAVARSDAPDNHADNTADVWACLNTGKLPPTMMTMTPTPEDTTKRPVGEGAGASVPPIADKPVDAGPPTPVAEKVTPDGTPAGPGSPVDSPVGTGRTHVVKQGEMLTSIAAAVYGDSRQWKRIAAANPNVNPNRLKLGSTLVIPAAAPASTSAGTASSGSNDATAVLASAKIAPIDPQKQYQIQPNDNLYRISIKLYGKADHVQKIYEANKDTIGADPARLKLHMILKLPEPPTNAASH